MTAEDLVYQAIEAREMSYSPYSKFAVGAALLTKNDEVYLGTNIENAYLGTNIENAAFGLSMCAERNALYNAYCHGVSQEDIEAIAIVADTELPVSPCGSCRQVLSELFPKSGKIYLANMHGDIKETTIDELLPYSFDSDDL